MKNEEEKFKRITGLALVTLLLTVGLVSLCPVSATVIPNYHQVWLNMENGAYWSNLSTGDLSNPSYYFKLSGGGLNALHMTSSTSSPYGQVTHQGAKGDTDSGTFYITDTGGRGFNDDIILMVAVEDQGTGVPENLNLGINASGYRWQPTAVLQQIPAQSDVHYIPGAVDQYFDASNFATYGYQTWKPCTSSGYRVDASNSGANYWLGFIDLNVGDLGLNTTVKYADSLIDNGAVKVTYNVTGLNGANLAFNGYGWCNQSNQGKGVSWTNDLTSSAASGWDINI
jgi:hypothetical protein